MNVRRHLVAVVLVLLVAGCASAPYSYREPTYVEQVGPGTVLRSLTTDPAIEDKILALDPERISEADVRTILAAGPAPRIMNLHGGLVGVHLVLNSFVRFLVAMGYPEAKIRNPRDGEFTWSPYADGAQQAGSVAWFYEKEGMRPLLIGHSQGGVQAIKILDELAGEFGDEVQVWNPVTDAAEARSSIVDPLTGRSRPVVGLSVAYVSVVGAGGTALWMPNQWNMAGRLDAIPANVDEFTGFYIELDFIALDFPGAADSGRFHATGATLVRNVRLPANYSHIGIALTEHLAQNPAMRAWIDAYRPDASNLTPIPEGDSENILWAADVWYGIKKHWCIEAQRLIRARRALASKAAPG